jgi:hypothetical protein
MVTGVLLVGAGEVRAGSLTAECMVFFTSSQ